MIRTLGTRMSTFRVSWKASVPAMQTRSGNISFQLPEGTSKDYVRFYARNIVERSMGPGIEVSIPLIEEVYFDGSPEMATQ